MNKRKLVSLTAVLAVAGFALAALSYNGGGKEQVSIDTRTPRNNVLIRPYSPTFGPKDAPVTIVEFFDPACEACKAFHPVVKKIMAEFPGRVSLVLRYTAFHPSSNEAIVILETARLQNLFEPVLQALYDGQAFWAPHGSEPANAWQFAANAGLDVDRAREQTKNPEIVAAINQDAADVASAGVQKTPTFFVNGKPLTVFGAQQLFDLVESEVEATSGGSGG